ncbi:receptor-transporting protein 3 isoform X2 [Tetranychus urticae]|uniref:receptor-transporting protein 3 isoform X2 n=1 Tax=Tetranychus urticae TaxID=32264 RepID=UPI00077BF974|nr:receptor-transporting protein 3 isoform X2 [Tetranychus urticae]
MCVFDPSSLTLCNPLVPLTVAYSPLHVSPATALCSSLPGLPTHHHITTLSPGPQVAPALATTLAPSTPLTATSVSHLQTPNSLSFHSTSTQPQPLPLPPSIPSFIPPSSTTGYYIQQSPSTLTSSTNSSPINGCPPLIKPSPWNQSYGMEHVWMAHFTSLFKSYPHQWCLLPVEQRPLGGNFTTFVDSAKVRFCCEDCGHGWTSMKGRVAFWFDLTAYSGYSQGLVTFKLFGQQCQKCKSEMYEAPMWYPEEVFKVLINLFNKVGQNYYGFYYPPLEKTRRPGKPRTPHNSQLCQACKDGVCTNRK